jgi:tetratricopeptide (TPR) repeat protein
MSRIESQLASLGSQLASVDRDVSVLERVTSSLGAEVSRIQQTVAMISGCISSAEGHVSRIGDDLARATSTLSDVAGRLVAESEHEREGREQVTQRLESLGAAQRNLGDVLKDGLAATTSRLGTLREKEASFQTLVSDSAKVVERLIREFGEELGHQVTDIEERVASLGDDEADGSEEAGKAFQSLLSVQQSLGEILKEIRQSSDKLAADMAEVVRHEKEAEDRKLRQAAAEGNVAGIRLLAMGQAEVAVEVLKRAVACAQGLREPRLNLAAALLRQNRLADAQGVYQELLRDSPDDADVLLFGGILAMADGRYDEAAELLERCERARHEDEAAAEALCIVHFLADRPTEARRWLASLTPGAGSTRDILQRLLPADGPAAGESPYG